MDNDISNNNREKKLCEFCAEEIYIEAKLCRFCGKKQNSTSSKISNVVFTSMKEDAKRGKMGSTGTYWLKGYLPVLILMLLTPYWSGFFYLSFAYLIITHFFIYDPEN